ncbi:VOC family protein [Nonomuraea typhae]|uniref:VOC family protein n=1 Tax=Nonomuraea typhae TaxID=2603600 RepID=UPI0012FB20FE|nr:VOC family protein [Nonomuraea typhae]
MQISTVTVPVSDQDAALDFYTRALGMRMRTDNPAPMGRWLTVAPSESGTSLLLASWFPEMAPIGGLILTAPGLDALAERLAGYGAATEGPSDQPWGRRLLVHDPFGNGYVVSEE